MGVNQPACVAVATSLLIRPHAWWINKIPLSVFLMSVLLANGPLSLDGFLLLIAVVAIVSCVANFGFGLNELFDQKEDALAGRPNVASERGTKLVWCATLLSAGLALALATLAAGVAGGILTALELLLPVTYSIPPIRTKERGILAVISDATAAHVYPAVLAMLVIAHLGILSLDHVMIAAVVLWSVCAGLRGIIAHLIVSLDHDRAAGLETFAHRIGARHLTLLILTVLLPLEILSIAVVFAKIDGGLPLAIFVAVFVGNELRRFCSPSIRKAFASSYEGRTFATVTDRYVPFANEMLYRTWGPLLIPVCAAWHQNSPGFLAVSVLFAWGWWTRFRMLSWQTM
jgi:4-hydroxybenzoate polyprenyltransferase